ncbi:MAG: protein translocase subunit SecD [Phycisphaeraceae bacterium]|nr:protein translocase subunit SecD [Phycisphaeraceae bacterium]
MRHILRNAIFSLAILVIAVSAIFPVDKNIRLGKDLRGGVSLVYAVQIRPGDDARDVLNRTIEVLKNRVDPNGMMEISMTAQGRDRIEVTMPLPGERVKQLAAAYEAKLAAVRARMVTAADVDRLARLAPTERASEIARLSAGDSAQAARLERAAAAFDAASTSRESLRRAEAEGRPESELDDLAAGVAAGEREYESARAETVRANLSAEDIRQALSLSNRTRTLQGEDGTFVTLPSPRARALTRIRELHPEAGSQLDEVLAAYATLESERRTLDDSSDLKRLLRGAGVLSFRIVCDVGEHPSEQSLREELRRIGPRNAKAPDAGWYKINQLENWYQNIAQQRAMEQDPASYFAIQRGMVAEAYDGEVYVLCWNTRTTRLTQEDGPWGVASAFASQDDIGKPAISFVMDARGAVRLGDLTRDHVGDKMAVLLDDEVYTAPVLNNPISKNGIIMGDFSQAEITYIVRVLTAGSLTARLSPEPISENTLGPELGADNLRQGVSAGRIALAAIGVFMIVYYFFCGGIAVFGLCCTAVIVVGAMALNRAAFTLPGIAGVILTFGMAVDANVLIFERIREELQRGEDMRTAVKLGHAKAFSSIFDGNVTNLIVCVVLAYTGTPEIKGFAITLGIGVVATLFSALLITRTIFDAAVTYGGWRATSMLPMAIKPIGRILSPNIDWIRLRGIFLVFSVVYVGLGIVMIAVRGERMLDTEFRGGVQVTLRFGLADEQVSTRHTMTRREVEERVRGIGERAGERSSLAQMRSAEVLPINAEDDGVTSSTFIVRTTVTDQNSVVESLTTAFQDVLDVRPSLSFDRDEVAGVRDAPVYQVLFPRLGDSIDRPGLLDDVTPFLGGVAIVLENLSPPQSLEDIKDRLESLRGQPDFSDTTSRKRDVLVLAGTPDAVTGAVVLVHDPATSAFDNPDQWWTTVATREWRLVVESLTTPTTLAEVRSFSAAVAENFKAKAVASILLSILLIAIYIWVRFGSALYSAAAVACLFHDVLTCVGFVALAEVLWDIPSLQPALQSLGIMPFKIDLNLIAALLTIIGYSLNDTIIIMDRIRENRGKVAFASRDAINNAINQTISRTVITSGTTLMAIVILYAFGGPGVRAFAFTMLVGVAIGTYSSIAVGAPIVWSKKSERLSQRSLSGTKS